MKKKSEIKSLILHGVQFIFRDFVPKDLMFTVSTPDERGVRQIIVTKIKDHHPKGEER